MKNEVQIRKALDKLNEVYGTKRKEIEEIYRDAVNERNQFLEQGQANKIPQLAKDIYEKLREECRNADVIHYQAKILRWILDIEPYPELEDNPKQLIEMGKERI